MDFARLKMLINELLACVHLLQVHRIGFGYLWNEGLLLVNGMVKRSLGGEFSVFWFIKHLSILHILWREFLFDLFSSLGKGSGKCELSNIQVVFSQRSSKGCLIPLLGVYLGGILRFISFDCP